MTFDISRRMMLFGRHRQVAEPGVLYPPWAAADFTARCTRCNACVTACPTQIIRPGSGGFPEVDFQQGECTFCGACRDACTPHALDAATSWPQKALIGQGCLAAANVECRICGESCPESAIRFQWQAGKVAQPVLSSELCSGCGACVAPCPASVIKVVLPRNE